MYLLTLIRSLFSNEVLDIMHPHDIQHPLNHLYLKGSLGIPNPCHLIL